MKREYRLNELFDLQMGKTPARKNPEYWNSEDHKWVSIADLSNCGKYIVDTKEYISDRAVEESGISLIPKNTVIMSFKLSIGKTAITSEPMYSNEAIMSFRDKHVIELLPDYLYYMFSGQDWEAGTNKAVMGKTLNKATLSSRCVKVHGIEKQREIVTVLDKVKAVLDSREEELEKLDELIKARFVEMFGDPIINPRGLETASLGNLSCFITKGASPRWQGFSYTDDETQTLFVTSENVREGYIDLTKPKYIKDEFNNKQSRSILQKGDFLINIVGASIGRAAQFLYDCKANINQAAALVRLKDKRIRDNYLLIYLNSEKAQQMYNSMKSDTGRANLSLQDIANLSILIPPIPEQKEFERFVDQVDKSKVA